MNRTADRKQIVSGLLFAAIGAIALWQLPSVIGTVRSMGPGYFPMLLSICLIVFGTVSVIQGLRASEPAEVGQFPIVATAIIVLGVFVFALLLNRLGLAISLAVLVLSCSYRRVLIAPLEVLLIYLVLLGLTWFVFIDLIQLPIDLYILGGAQ